MTPGRKLRSARGKRYTLGKLLGSGGEAEVLAISGDKSLVAKLYRVPPGAAQRAKLEWMIAHPPSVPPGRGIGIAWPQDLLLDDAGGLAGILLPRVRDGLPLITAFNPKRRAAELPQFDRVHLLLAAQRLAEVVEAMHRAGYVIGDLNESNVLISPAAEVTLIDADSFQVRALRDAKVTTYRSPVGKPEYTPPEIQGMSFKDVDRKYEHDRFALAVLLFQLLMEGRHPYAGRWLGSGEPPTLERSIQQGLYSYSRASTVVQPPPHAPALDWLEPGLAPLFERSFGITAASFLNRASAEEWAQALAIAVRAPSQRPATPPVAAPRRDAPRTPPGPSSSRPTGAAPPPFGLTAMAPATIAATLPRSTSTTGGAIPQPPLPHAVTLPGGVVIPGTVVAQRAAQPPRKSRRGLWILLGIIALLLMLNNRNEGPPAPRRSAPISAPRERAAATWTPAPPTATRESGLAPVPPEATRASDDAPSGSFDDAFTLGAPEDEVDEPAYAAHVSGGRMRLDIRRPDAFVTYSYEDRVTGDFTFTLTVESTAGHGEALAMIGEPDAGRRWAFAVDPVAETWSLYRQNDAGTDLFVWITPRKLAFAIDPLRTITVQRERGDLSLWLNGERVASANADILPGFDDTLQVGFGAVINPENRFGFGQTFEVAFDRATLESNPAGRIG